MTGVNNVYEPPTYEATSDIALLKPVSNNITVISVDGKSSNKQPIVLKPGKHKIALYVGKNNSVSGITRLIVLIADFKANQIYIIRTQGFNVWIEDSNGVRLNSSVSDMQIEKSVSL